MDRKVAVVGVGNTSYTSAKRETRERTEVSADCIKAGFDFVGKGLSMDDVDSIFYASVDAFEGVQRPDRSMDCLGQSLNKATFFVHTGGTAGGSAFKEAYHSVKSGLCDIVIALGASTTSATVEAQQILNSASPPLIEKPFGAGAIHMAGYYLMRYKADYNITAEDFAMVAAKSHKHAVNNPYAHIRKGFTVEEILASPMVCSPIHLYEICPVSAGATCVIMASEEKAKELSDTPVWIKAIDSISNTFLAGYRPFTSFYKLEILAKRVYEKAGIKNPLEDIDYAELFNPFAGFELLEYEALGFCDKGDAPKLVRDGITDYGGKLPCTLSGGTLCTNSGISASMSRHAETVLQLMGKVEGGRQVKNAKTGIAHSWGGNMGQFHTLCVLSV